MDVSNTPVAGVERVVPDAVASVALNADAARAAILNIAESVNFFINALLPILLGVVVVAFFVFLVRYTLARGDAVAAREYLKGATRALVAIFLMVNMWTIIRAVDWVMGLSPTLMYLILIVAFTLFGAWSLFAIGDACVALVSRVLRSVADVLVRALRDVFKGTAAEKKLGALRPNERRLLVLAVLALLFSLIFTL